MKEEVFDFSPDMDVPPTTSIIVPTYREERLIRTALNTLEAQTIRREFPDLFEVIVVDSGSEDRTVEIAREYTRNILLAPKGKLTARDIGIMAAKGKVIVGVDADTYYPPNWLNIILRNFRQGVVGVTSPRLYGPPMKGSNFLLDAVGVWNAVFNGLHNRRMPGSNGAFLRSAYFDVGGFDLSINQFDSSLMVKEEEYDFPDRLRRLGRVVWEWKAPCFTSTRRYGEKEVERSFARICQVCGYPLSVPDDTPLGTEVSCPRCGAVYEAVPLRARSRRRNWEYNTYK